jgi:hypothetical protein
LVQTHPYLCHSQVPEGPAQVEFFWISELSLWSAMHACIDK